MTVAELIVRLQAMPHDAQVYVHDADTEWLLLVADSPYHGAAVRLASDEERRSDNDGQQVVIQSEGY